MDMLFLQDKYMCVSVLNLTQLVESVNYVYPFNNGVFEDIDCTFRAFGGDLALNDKLRFTSNANCI